MLIDTSTVTLTPAYQRPYQAATGAGKKSFSELFASVTQAQAARPAAASQASNAESTNYRAQLLNAAKADPVKAEKLLAFSTAPESGAFPLIDISQWPAVRYSVSGELQTPQSQAYVSETAASAAKARDALLHAERSKGTPAAAILEKVLALNSALPLRYKAMANIGY
ncbi:MULTISPECIES: hypothetical protein [unclassified Janthinobacterium]|uniref:hypothetical protein n=1 Tax=unclassified Janthinobacterium TaxID=2610881 RepID=UPI001614E914|nr:MULTISPECIES: hypothetical protein [unclassified Janthinobacterium]MBB5610887.1 hypothetical protein [Janthinobacterium sp. S3T4]MBB5616343.1 hypothetical protein [Janthinobacterium sp. S3M3]